MPAPRVDRSRVRTTRPWPPASAALAITALLALACSDETSEETPFWEGGASLPEDPPPTEVIIAEPPPPPIQGGTLAVTTDGLAVAADPDRDRIYVVDLTSNRLKTTFPLEPGARPGRVAVAEDGRVFVALRGAGAVLTLDPVAERVVERRRTCSAPSGLTVDAQDTVHVACETGELWSFPVSGRPTVSRLEPDLRDVVAHDDVLYVSRFRAAEVLVLDGARSVRRRIRPRAPAGWTDVEAHVAWRLIHTERHGVHLLHQLHDNTPIPKVGPYYADTPCSSRVTSAVTRLSGDGEAPATVPLIGPLLTDFAVSADGSSAVTALTGAASDDPARRPIQVVRYPLSEGWFSSEPDCSNSHPDKLRWEGFEWDGGVQVTAVAFDPSGHVLAQSREPAALLRWTDVGAATIVLDETSRADTGLLLFHATTGANLTCASCHPAGLDDGHVWAFEDLGPRRTQSLAGTLLGTAPYHAAGDMAALETLLDEVYTTRMLGRVLEDESMRAFTSWLLRIEPPRQPPRSAAAARGEALFGAMGCANCHSGPALTNNETVDVGTGGPLQVPSLVGLGRRAPYFHDGCASTLVEIFEAACGGGLHGAVGALRQGQLAELVAFLESL